MRNENNFNHKISLKAAILLTTSFAVLALAPSAAALPQRTWVSGTGLDSNPCSRSQPCQTWAGALGKTAAGGEIDALDAGDFGYVNVTKAITLDGGPDGFILAGSSADAIDINAGSTAIVTIRNLSLNGASGQGNTGIVLTAAASVHLENLRIFGFNTNGVFIDASTMPNTTVFMNNVVITDVGTWGVAMYSGKLDAEHLVVHSAATNGLYAALGANITVHHSDLSQNATGVMAVDQPTVVTLDGVTVAQCGVGVHADNSGTVALSNTSVFKNSTGLSATQGGAIVSFVNNRIYGNQTNGAPTQSFYQR